jgi:hypothetical protein
VTDLASYDPSLSHNLDRVLCCGIGIMYYQLLTTVCALLFQPFLQLEGRLRSHSLSIFDKIEWYWYTS